MFQKFWIHKKVKYCDACMQKLSLEGESSSENLSLELSQDLTWDSEAHAKCQVPK